MQFFKFLHTKLSVKGNFNTVFSSWDDYRHHVLGEPRDNEDEVSVDGSNDSDSISWPGDNQDPVDLDQAINEVDSGDDSALLDLAR